jgi:hypothetical protein
MSLKMGAILARQPNPFTTLRISVVDAPYLMGIHPGHERQLECPGHDRSSGD